jgi:hypothetical protein
LVARRAAPLAGSKVAALVLLALLLEMLLIAVLMAITP